jgi:ATP-dependent Clp protease adaptor protein ClpS
MLSVFLEGLQMSTTTKDVGAPRVDIEKDTDVAIQEPATVILFNDEIHTFDEVIEQLIKALRCDTTKAEALTWEVHNSGKAAVYKGEMSECLKVNSVLEEIALHTQIEVGSSG